MEDFEDMLDEIKGVEEYYRGKEAEEFIKDYINKKCKVMESKFEGFKYTGYKAIAKDEGENYYYYGEDGTSNYFYFETFVIVLNKESATKVLKKEFNYLGGE